MKTLSFEPVITPQQGTAARIVCFSATAQQVATIARIDRIGRDGDGILRGFQRPQIAKHIREIRDYLSSSEAILPNAIVLAFADGTRLHGSRFSVDLSEGPPGWVVDGQQRLTAALSLGRSDFQLLVSAFVCDDMAELKRQFILVNNTRPLAKPLIYELLPGTSGLPHRLSDRMEAAILTEALNYRPDSVLQAKVQQQTNPDGAIRDTVLQRMLINSIQHGALRTERSGGAVLDGGFAVVNAFFGAVAETFSGDWHDHDAKTSRLLHGVGITAMGYVMDELHARNRARTSRDFKRGLKVLVGRTHWSSGDWRIGAEQRPWNSLQNTSADYRLLSHHLVRIIRRS